MKIQEGIFKDFEYKICMTKKDKVHMKRNNYYLTLKEIENLETEAREIGCSVSEVIRRVLDLYFYKKNKKNCVNP